MRIMYEREAFEEAMERRDEGFVLYNDESVEFFERIEQANKVFENCRDAIECGFVEDEWHEYFNDLDWYEGTEPLNDEAAEEFRKQICKEYDIDYIPVDLNKLYI